MLNEKVAEELKTLIPEDMVSRAVVAGGYACDAERANDIDLWILDCSDLDEAEAHVRKHLRKIHRLSLYAGDYAPEYEEFDSTFRVVSEQSIRSAFGQSVQIIITSSPDVHKLLRRFDISTHQVGYFIEHPDVRYSASTYKTPFDQPRLVHVTGNPEATLERLNKICKRYGFLPHPEDVKLLLELIEKKVAA